MTEGRVRHWFVETFMTRVALATVILGAIALTADGQQSVRLSGRVVADDTGDPLANARVTLSPATPGVPAVLTDRDGRFTLMTTSTRVTVTASKSSYTRREIAVTSTETPLELRLPRAAAVSGRVVDEFGDPVVGARVTVERPTDGPPAKSAIVASAATDDRGDYRIGTLPPGALVVATLTRGELVRQVIGPNQIATFPSTTLTYYPGTDSIERAERLRLQPGDDRPSIDFVLPPGQRGDFVGVQASPFDNAQDRRWTGVVRGRVVSTDGRSLPRAEVRTVTSILVRDPQQPDAPPAIFRPMSVTADQDGRFELSGLPAGRLQITAAKVGYSPPGAAAMDLPPNLGVRVDLADGEVRERVDITLAPWGSLSGRIVDELGEPVQGVSVQLLQVRYQGGRRRLVGAMGGMRQTDDLGRYRIFGLAPRPYVVSAAVGDVSSAELPGYTRSYYPGTPNAGDAQFVTVGVSTEISGIDFSLSRAKTATISGTLLNAAGEPSTSGGVRLIPSQRSGAITAVAAGARLERDGRFEFPNVTPGQYVIQVDRGRRSSSREAEFAAVPVSVDGVDIAGLVIQTSAGSSIAGRVTFEAFHGTREPRRNEIEIVPVPTDTDQSPAPASAEIRDDWTFTAAGVNGPRRLHLQRAPAAWTLKAIKVRGIDVTDRPLPFGRSDQSLTDVEVVLTDRVSAISGTIVDDHAQPAPGAHVIVFPIDRDRWYPASRYLRTAIAGEDGAIGISGVAAASYYAAAVAQLPADGNDAWQDPAFLESLLPRAASFALGEGQTQRLSLRLPAASAR